jgi:predicted metallopeptidase
LYLDRLPTSVQILAVVSGLELHYDENQSWNYFQRLNAFQRLYAVIKLVELTVGNEPLYKAEMLKEWFGSSVANKLARVSSEMMENFSEKGNKQ